MLFSRVPPCDMKGGCYNFIVVSIQEFLLATFS